MFRFFRVLGPRACPGRAYADTRDQIRVMRKHTQAISFFLSTFLYAYTSMCRMKQMRGLFPRKRANASLSPDVS